MLCFYSSALAHYLEVLVVEVWATGTKDAADKTGECLCVHTAAENKQPGFERGIRTWQGVITRRVKTLKLHKIHHI